MTQGKTGKAGLRKGGKKVITAPGGTAKQKTLGRKGGRKR